MPPQHKSLTDPKALFKELSDNNAFFDDLVDMIPAKLYVAGNSGKNINQNQCIKHLSYSIEINDETNKNRSKYC